MNIIAKRRSKNIWQDWEAMNLFSGSREKRRSCLMCDKLFLSKGPHNRRCPKCSTLVNLKSKNSNFFIPHMFTVKYLPVKDVTRHVKSSYF